MNGCITLDNLNVHQPKQNRERQRTQVQMAAAAAAEALAIAGAKLFVPKVDPNKERVERITGRTFMRPKLSNFIVHETIEFNNPFIQELLHEFDIFIKQYEDGSAWICVYAHQDESCAFATTIEPSGKAHVGLLAYAVDNESKEYTMEAGLVYAHPATPSDKPIAIVLRFKSNTSQFSLRIDACTPAESIFARIHALRRYTARASRQIQLVKKSVRDSADAHSDTSGARVRGRTVGAFSQPGT